MQSIGWITGRFEFSVEFFEYSPVRPESFNGTICVMGTDQEFAFSGLAEFWKVVAKIRGETGRRAGSELMSMKMMSILQYCNSLSAPVASLESANDRPQ